MKDEIGRSVEVRGLDNTLILGRIITKVNQKVLFATPAGSFSVIPSNMIETIKQKNEYRLCNLEEIAAHYLYQFDTQLALKLLRQTTNLDISLETIIKGQNCAKEKAWNLIMEKGRNILFA